MLSFTLNYVLCVILLICLVFVAFQHNYAAATSGFQESKSVGLKINAGGNIQKVWSNRKEVSEKKLRKTPSGPSPVGNHRPPSKA
ncbi:hypothetical protein ACS0TY_003212 [Phlomoides rotata]